MMIKDESMHYKVLAQKLSLAIVLALAPLMSFGAEADHYSQREQPLKDMLPAINQMANNYLRTSIKAANAQGLNCSEEVLYKEMRKYFNNHSKGELVIEALYGDEIEKRIIPLNESIYEEWSVWDGFLLGRSSAASSPLALSPMVRMGEFVIGIDKLEHMFGMGFRYFNDHYLKGHNISRVLNKGIIYEKTILGGNIVATGVFAYADLAANFNGMRFWNSVVAKRADILNQKITPYVECIDGEFEQVGVIDLSAFIDASFDESINCSKVARKRSARKLLSALEKRSKTYKCPMNKETHKQLLEKYNLPAQGSRKGLNLADFVINGEGIERRSLFNEF